jgi:hypothetical protein
MPDRGLPSTEDLCSAAVRRELVALGLPGYDDGRPLQESEIQERENWYTDDTPHRGLSIHTLGERFSPPPLGLQDVAYGVAITGAVKKSGTANRPSKLVGLWMTAARRRFQHVRIPIGDELSGGVRRNVCHVTPGRPDIPRRKSFRDWEVRQIIVWFWTRETPDAGE